MPEEREARLTSYRNRYQKRRKQELAGDENDDNKQMRQEIRLNIEEQQNANVQEMQITAEESDNKVEDDIIMRIFVSSLPPVYREDIAINETLNHMQSMTEFVKQIKILLGTVQDILFEDHGPPCLPIAVFVTFDRYKGPTITNVEGTKVVPITLIKRTWE
ncbi:9365_t:CDS:2, partial [Racocetra fulgida]